VLTVDFTLSGYRCKYLLGLVAANAFADAANTTAPTCMLYESYAVL
jgi:hypothetical protein